MYKDRAEFWEKPALCLRSVSAHISVCVGSVYERMEQGKRKPRHPSAAPPHLSTVLSSSLWIQQEMPEAETVLWLFDSSNRWFPAEQVSLLICSLPPHFFFFFFTGKCSIPQRHHVERRVFHLKTQQTYHSFFPVTGEQRSNHVSRWTHYLQNHF